MPFQFRGQHRNEEVLLVCRQHPFVLLHPMLVSTALFLVPFVIDIFFSTGLVLSVSIVVFFIAALVHGFLAWYAWQNSMFLLTTERVVYLEQRHLLHREFIECGLANIQQVSHEVKGLLHTLLGYGSISISSGGSQQPVVMRNLPDPYELQQEIQRAGAGEIEE